METKIKSAKFKTHMKKEQLLKLMKYSKMNQFYSLSYDETLFLSYQKVPKLKAACSYSKEGDLYWLEDSPVR